MMNPDSTQSPGRAIDAWRHWFRHRQALRGRAATRPPAPDGFAVTEWADTEAGCTTLLEADEGLYPPHPLAG
jgi:hypothetical protein